jgi:hypothetical protein
VPYATVRPVLRAARKQSRGAHAHRMDEPPVQVACEQNELSMPSPGLLELSTLEWDSTESGYSPSRWWIIPSLLAA